MSDIEMELLCEEENIMDVNERELLSSEEEGEISDSEEEEEKKTWKNTPPKDEAVKAKNDNIINLTHPDGEDQLYTSLGVEECRHTRFDTIHMYGTKDMDTSDIYHYFSSHKPLFLEWVSETSCNIVWPDNISAAQAIKSYSSESHQTAGLPPGKWRVGLAHPKADHIYMRFATRSDKNATRQENLKMLSKKYKGLDVGLVSKSLKHQITRVEQDHSEGERAKNPWGELCHTWGIHDTQEVFGASSQNYASVPYHRPIKERIGKPSLDSDPIDTVTSRRRKKVDLKMRLGKRAIPTKSLSDDSESEGEVEDDSEEEWRSRSKVPRMRMHADDEEKRMGRGKVKSRVEGLDEDIDNITVQINNQVREHHSQGDLRRKLTQRREEQDASSDSEDARGNVWSRLQRHKQEHSHSEDEDADEMRYVLSKTCPKAPQTRPGFNQTDLRSRLGKKVPGSPLRIEVDNEHYAP